MFEDTYFVRKKANGSKLLSYGFEEKNHAWRYERRILDDQFRLVVLVSASGEVSTQMFDTDTDTEYVLYKDMGVVGSFVGDVRAACVTILEDIADKCFDPEVFKQPQTKEIIRYVNEKYGDELEFLWEKFPDNAVWRRKDNRKWYGAILTVARRKLDDGKSDAIVEILDLRMEKGADDFIDKERFYPGWHMNKKSWYTILLDGTVETKEIFQRIDESYQLAKR